LCSRQIRFVSFRLRAAVAFEGESCLFPERQLAGNRFAAATRAAGIWPISGKVGLTDQFQYTSFQIRWMTASAIAPQRLATKQPIPISVIFKSMAAPSDRQISRPARVRYSGWPDGKKWRQPQKPHRHENRPQLLMQPDLIGKLIR